MFLFDTSRVIVKLIIGIFLCFNISAFANQCNTNSSIADVVEKLSPAIVNISTTQLVENGNKNLPFSEMPEEFFKFFEEFNEYPSHLSLLSYDLVGLVYYLSMRSNLSNINKVFKKKNSFKGKIGIFDIKNNKIYHRLNFYKIEDKKIIEIF